MPLTQSPVLALVRIDVECDRCHKRKSIDLNVTIEQQEQGVDALDYLPEYLPAWKVVRHPADGLLVFHDRSCMSAWFATFVRTLYGGPAELPKRQVPARRKKAAA